MGHTLSQASTRKHPRAAISIKALGALDVLTIKFDGEILSRMLYEACNLTNTPSRQILILDVNGATYYSGPTFTNNAGTPYAPTGGIELDGTYTIQPVLAGGASGATGGTGPGDTDYLTLFVR
jgi:hypothetical protein